MNRKIVGSLSVFAAITVLLISTGLSSAQSAPATRSCAMSEVNMGMAGHFRILAATTVTDTGVTMIRGNVGVSPGTSVTGFAAGSVMGAIYTNDSFSAQGEASLAIAYANASARTTCATTVSGNIGGQTFTPGLYVSTSSLAISSGNLVLNAHGDSKAVFMFTMASTFTMTSGLHVILKGGANASRIYWVVGSSATLGTGTILYGNILADVSISMDSGSLLHGRALAITGAVTLIGTKIYRNIHP
jgi:ice-binding like protein